MCYRDFMDDDAARIVEKCLPAKNFQEMDAYTNKYHLKPGPKSKKQEKWLKEINREFGGEENDS